ncbi:MAG: glycogen/starch/alpha-glucan family phosphorylase [Planctomycetia bacterium]|nr:glycogen/starch/alpha-glucan family phosphorylase [Planctomycetia bacterium]
MTRPTGPQQPLHQDPTDVSADHIAEGMLEHLAVESAQRLYEAPDRDRFFALASEVREVLMKCWLDTRDRYRQERSKRVCFLSIEFLLGRAMRNNILNLKLESRVREALEKYGIALETLESHEHDAGLGNGGLGRLAACFLDSMTSMAIPSVGYTLRYEYGIFKQEVRDGYQVERPDNWLRFGDPWMVRRSDLRQQVQFGDLAHGGRERVIGVPHDYPVAGWGGETVHTIRCWSAVAPDAIDLSEIASGDYEAAVSRRIEAERLTKLLYPDDRTAAGKELRLRQEFFFVCCSVADIMRRFLFDHDDVTRLPEQVALHINDTHPSLAIAELMRVLMDQHGLGWDEAWETTVGTVAYTNHTLMPEALEKWPMPLMEKLMPRHLAIILEVNRRFIEGAGRRLVQVPGGVEAASIVEEGEPKQVRMANLAVIGSHSVNGVSQMHGELIKERLMPHFATVFPDRFKGITNGVTPRRWLHQANPQLSDLLVDTIGDGWITDLSELKRLEPHAEDPGFRNAFAETKLVAKRRMADWIGSNLRIEVDPTALFDVQVKRIHEYKRQFLNLLHVASLYQRMKADPGFLPQPRVVIFAGKAAPGYERAKDIIKAITSVADVVNADPVISERLRVVFIPDYGVNLAETIIPAADLSEQISLAGTEASGTGNMKFCLNGALTIGTLDGANVEISEEVGTEHMFLFGLRADEVEASESWYDPRWHLDHEPMVRNAVDFLLGEEFAWKDPLVFGRLRTMLIEEGDRWRHLADLQGYIDAQQHAADRFGTPDQWWRSAVLNTARGGRFSSDRAIQEYADRIWRVKSVPATP